MSQPRGGWGDPIRALVPLISPVASALGAHYEIVLHDFQQLPNSIVAIAGTLTDRKIGGPATDVLLRAIRTGHPSDLIRYITELPDGTFLNSSTVFVHDHTGKMRGALCINCDMSAFRQAEQALAGIVAWSSTAASDSVLSDRFSSAEAAPSGDGNAISPAGEKFAKSIQDLTDELVNRALNATNVPPELMQKRHKLQIVAQLDSQGVFLIRDSVDYVAKRLRSSRYTIYKYLAEIKEASASNIAADRVPSTD